MKNVKLGDIAMSVLPCDCFLLNLVVMFQRRVLNVGLVAAGIMGASSSFLQVAKAEPSPAAAPTDCKAYNGKCCDAAVAAHLPKQVVLATCGKTEAEFLGEQGSKDTCKYIFKIANEKDGNTFVQVYAPAQKQPGTAPTDPFFDWTRVGKAYVTKKAKTPKAAPMLQNMTGIWYPGKDYVVNINASLKVCSKAQALKLAAKLK